MNKFNIMVWFLAGALTLYAERVSVTYKVTDEGGVPIEGASVETIVEKEESLLRWYGSPKYDRHVKTTDSSGEAACNFRIHNGDFCVSVKAEGFYGEVIESRFDATYDMKRERYVFTENTKDMQIHLRKIVAPITMANFRFKTWKIPSSAGNFGFDLERGSWVKPWGKGMNADLSVHYSLQVSNGVERCEGKIVFNNGGAYKLKKKISSSGFVSEYHADTNATYISEFPFSSFCVTTNSGEHGAMRVLNDDEYLIYKTRIVRNERGEIVSEHYGKIYGPTRTVGFLRFEELFFNPTPNDPNIEEKR